MSFEQPVLWLGLAGYSQALRTSVAALLASQPAGWPLWRIREFGEADAWWVNGAKIRLLRDGTLKVAPSLATERAVQINLGEVDRPIAFSTPIAPPEFEPAYQFALESQSSVRHVLQQFEGWLRPLRAQFALGAEVIRREAELKPEIYHLSHKGALLAVVDLNEWNVGISPTARPVDLDQASWDKRPRGANDIPTAFVRSSLTQIMWTYAQRTERDVLPARYRNGLIYFRRAPQVPAGLLKDSHQSLVKELSAAPASFETLLQSRPEGAEQLARDLASLYFSGSLTSSPGKSASVRSRRAEQSPREPVHAPLEAHSPLGPDSRMLEPVSKPSYVLGVRA